MEEETIRSSQMTPMSYLKIFFRRKELFIFPAFAGLIIGICAGIVLPKKYTSSTVLLVEEGKTDNPLFDKLAVSSTVVQRMSTISESMLGWNSLVKLVKRLNMDTDIKSPQELEVRILGIRKNILIKMKGPNIIDLSYVGDTPELTQAVVKNITEIFIERNVEIQNEETSTAISFIEEQLKVYRGKIKSAEIARLKESLSTLLVDSTEQHPRVKQLREQIGALEEELKKEKLEYTESVGNLTATANPIIQDIKKSLDDIEGISGNHSNASSAGNSSLKNDYYKVLLVDKLDKVMSTDAGVNNQIYNMLLQRLETAKITQRLQTSKEGTRYTVLDPPRIPLSPTKPNKLLVGFMGFFMGAMVGFALVLGAEFLDKSFIDVEEATQFFGQPLLGAISKINTEMSIRKEHERQSWMYSLTMLVGLIIVIITTALTNLIK